jgi:hypothetical protein
MLAIGLGTNGSCKQRFAMMGSVVRSRWHLAVQNPVAFENARLVLRKVNSTELCEWTERKATGCLDIFCFQ